MVMTAFAAAIDALFADPNLGVNAIYRAGGSGEAITLRAIVRQPDRIDTFGETRIATQTTLFDIRTSELAAPVEGDTIEMDGAVSVIQGAPIRDGEQLVWTLDTRPAP